MVCACIPIYTFGHARKRKKRKHSLARAPAVRHFTLWMSKPGPTGIDFSQPLLISRQQQEIFQPQFAETALLTMAPGDLHRHRHVGKMLKAYHWQNVHRPHKSSSCLCGNRLRNNSAPSRRPRSIGFAITAMSRAMLEYNSESALLGTRIGVTIQLATNLVFHSPSGVIYSSLFLDRCASWGTCKMKPPTAYESAVECNIVVVPRCQ